MTRRDLEHRLRQLAWPSPSRDVRARVLRDAPAVAVAASWSDRLWFSRAWWVSVAAAVVALLTVDHLAGSVATRVPAGRPDSPAEVRLIEDTVRQAGLPPDLAAVLVRRWATPVPPRAIEGREEAVLQALGAEGERR